MKITKSWLFIILFALSVNVLHGFFEHSHQDPHDNTIENHIEYTDITKHEILCDSCQCCSCHVKSMLDMSFLEISHICIPKPQFEQPNTLLVSNTLQLLKPPTI